MIPGRGRWGRGWEGCRAPGQPSCCDGRSAFKKQSQGSNPTPRAIPQGPCDPICHPHLGPRPRLSWAGTVQLGHTAHPTAPLATYSSCSSARIDLNGLVLFRFSLW